MKNQKPLRKFQPIQKTLSEVERLAFNAGIELAAQQCEFYAIENFRLADDTVQHDPIMNGSTTKETVQEDSLKSEHLLLEGHGYCSRGHGARDLAENIRKLKVER